MSTEPPRLPEDPTLEEWLGWKSRRKYLESLNFAGIDEVSAWVREFYLDPERGRQRREELEAAATTRETKRGPRDPG